MTYQTAIAAPAAPLIKPKTSKDDRIMVGFILVICLYLLISLAFPLYAMLSKSFSTYAFDLTNFEFQVNTGDGWSETFSAAAQNEKVQRFMPKDLVTSSDGRLALAGTIIVFTGAYMVEKTNGFFATRSSFQFLAMMPMAIPGMVLGLAYIFFFNNPDNPLNSIYGTLAIMVICSVTHFYTVSHLTAVTALKQMDREFESVAASLKQPFHKLLSKVTVPVCLPSILDISIYLFVNAMTTVSAVIFLYSPDTTLASVAVLNMDDAGDVAPAAAMGMMIFYTNVSARLIHQFVSRKLVRRTQAWRGT